MKRTIILISIFFAFNYVCTAQVDTIKKTSDSLAIKENKVNVPDSLSAVVQPDSLNYALLYVYRPRNFTGSFVSYNLKMTNLVLKDSLIGRVKNNSKFVVKLYQEGKTQIFAHTESKRVVNINVKFGEKYYLKCEIAMGILVGRPQLSLIYPEQGELDYENVESK